MRAILEAVANVRPLSKRDALWLSDQIVDATIDALCRNPSITSRSFADWSLIFAGLRLRIGELLTAHIAGHVSLDEVLTTIEATAWPAS
jgi:hypothetical protein